MIISRRGLLVGLSSMVAAPAIVRASSLMPIAPIPLHSVVIVGLPPLHPNCRSVVLGVIKAIEHGELLISSSCHNQGYESMAWEWRIPKRNREVRIGDILTIGDISSC